MARSRRCQRAFTLVELLIYLLLLSVVSGTAMALMHYFFSSHVVVSQAEAMGSCSRFFDRLEDDLDNSLIRAAADIQIGNEGELVRFKRWIPGPPGEPDVEQDVVYALEDPKFSKGPSAVLRNGSPIMGVAVTEMWMELDQWGALVVHSMLVDSRSRVPWIADSVFLVPAMRQALVFGPFVSPVASPRSQDPAGGGS